MEIIQRYKDLIRDNFVSKDGTESFGISYWSDKLFIETITYLLPLSFIALVPGIFYSIEIEKNNLALFDIAIFLAVCLIAFVKPIPIQVKKYIFIFCMFGLGVFLLYEVGISGPGLIYLYAANIFSLLILPLRLTYLWSLITLLIISIFGILIFYDFTPQVNVISQSVYEWIAITSNLIFLCFISAALIPKLFIGLEKTILKKDEAQAELKNALQSSKENNEDLENFTYVISHDLQEPIRMISSFLTLLEKKYDNILDEKGKKYIFYSVDGAKRMKEIILQLLDFSRMSRLEISTEVCDIKLLIDNIIQENQKLIKDSKAKIHFSNLPKINSQKVALTHIFQNLISNALKYRKEDTPPNIHISYMELEKDHKFSVNDNGIGIEAKYFEKIFVIFQRLHDRSKYEGSGMGLAICKKILEKIGGKMWVESKTNLGSTFFFIIPKL